MTPDQTRHYKMSECISFRKTNEKFGGLSNMAPGFPLVVNGIRIRTSEALYQACRFPHLPKVQRMILDETSPMTAKMRSKPYRSNSRDDWDSQKIAIMRWCLRVKLIQNWKSFSQLLLSTGDLPIVEFSRKDQFWGAKPDDEGNLVGINGLGRLLMFLRESIRDGSINEGDHIEPLTIKNFALFGEAIGRVAALTALPSGEIFIQGSIFDDAGQVNRNVHHVRARSIPSDKNKNNAIQWISELPPRWNLVRTKYLFKERRQMGFPDEPLLVASQNYGVIEKREYGKRTVEAQKDLHLLKLVEPGDYVISLRTFQGGIEYAHKRGIISPAYTILRPGPQIRRGFYEYFFKSAPFIGSMTLFVTGIREGQNIDYVRLSRAYMPVPPLEEQDQIGRFIQNLDARVNKLIKAKRRLIELLNEQRIQIVTDALKLDGSQWVRLKNLVELKRRPITRTEAHSYTPIGLFNQGRGIFKKPEASGNDLGDSDFFEVRAGDLVLSGQFAWEGAVAVADTTVDRTIASHRYYTLQTRTSSVSVHYLQALFQTDFGDMMLNYHSRGGAGRNRPLNIRTLLKEKAPIPDGASVEHLDELSVEVRRAAVHVAREIELIREYRTRLVADVVTGQLDVRQHPWANSDPDQEDEALEAAPDDLEEEMLDESESEELSE